MILNVHGRTAIVIIMVPIIIMDEATYVLFVQHDEDDWERRRRETHWPHGPPRAGKIVKWEQVGWCWLTRGASPRPWQLSCTWSEKKDDTIKSMSLRIVRAIWWQIWSSHDNIWECRRERWPKLWERFRPETSSRPLCTRSPPPSHSLILHGDDGDGDVGDGHEDGDDDDRFLKTGIWVSWIC